MTDPVSTIRNLGPASDASFAKAGIHDAQMLRDLGPDEAYRRLLRTGTRPHFIGYYALVMGLQGRPWNDCKGVEKEKLRVRFDEIKAEKSSRLPETIRHQNEMEAILNKIGIIKRA